METKTGYPLPRTLTLNLMPKPGAPREMRLGGRVFTVVVTETRAPRLFIYGPRGAQYGALAHMTQRLADKGIETLYAVNPFRTGSTPRCLQGLAIIEGADGKKYLATI